MYKAVFIGAIEGLSVFLGCVGVGYLVDSWSWVKLNISLTPHKHWGVFAV